MIVVTLLFDPDADTVLQSTHTHTLACYTSMGLPMLLTCIAVGFPDGSVCILCVGSPATAVSDKV